MFEFVCHHFFNFDDDTFDGFCNYYEESNGKGSLKYLIRTYGKWKSGEVKMSTNTCLNILECVPKFMSKPQQFELLSFHIPDFYAYVFQDDSKTYGLSEIDKCYNLYFSRVSEYSLKLEWFVSGIFSEEEINEFHHVLKYAIQYSLTLSYEGLKSDLSLLKHFSGIDAAFDIKYEVQLLGKKFVVDKLNVNLSYKCPKISEPKIVSSFRDEFQKFHLNKIVEFTNELHKREIKHGAIIKDIASIKSMLNTIANKSTFDCENSYEGKGGLLYVNIVKKNKFSLVMSIIKSLLISLLITTGVVALTIYLGTIGTGLLFPSISFGIFILIFTWTFFWGTIAELKDYERKRLTAFT